MRKELSLFILIVIILSAGCTSTPEALGDSGQPAISSDSTLSGTLSSTAPSLPVDALETPVSTIHSDGVATPVPLASMTPSPTLTATPSICPYLQGRTEIGVLDSTAMGEQVRFLVHLPPCYHEYQEKAFPVLYLFHGWPLNEWHWDNLGIDEWRDDWVSRGLSGPFLVVLPGVGSDGRYVNSSGGDGSFEGFVVNELVPHVDKTYRTIVAPAGRAVGGISRGGVWALEIAMRHQDVFSRVGGHSPALALNRPLPQYDPFLLAKEGVSELRFYLDAGDADWARAATLQLHDLLVEVGADVTYQVHAGGHVDNLWRTGIPDYLAFYAGDWPASYAALPLWEPVEDMVTLSEP